MPVGQPLSSSYRSLFGAHDCCLCFSWLTSLFDVEHGDLFSSTLDERSHHSYSHALSYQLCPKTLKFSSLAAILLCALVSIFVTIFPADPGCCLVSWWSIKSRR